MSVMISDEQDHSEMPLPSGWQLSRKQGNKCWCGCGEIGTLACHWWDCKWCIYCGKQYDSSSEKSNLEVPYNPAISGTIYLK